MRAVLIDPFAYTVTEIAIERDPAAHSTLAAIYGALSHETMPVQYIEAVLLGRGEALFVDEEGAIKERYACGRARRWFRLQGYHNVLAGKGLILAATTRAPSAQPATAPPRSQPLVTFFDAEVMPQHLIETRTPWTA